MAIVFCQISTDVECSGQTWFAVQAEVAPRARNRLDKTVYYYFKGKTTIILANRIVHSNAEQNVV